MFEYTKILNLYNHLNLISMVCDLVWGSIVLYLCVYMNTHLIIINQHFDKCNFITKQQLKSGCSLLNWDLTLMQISTCWLNTIDCIYYCILYCIYYWLHLLLYRISYHSNHLIIVSFLNLNLFDFENQYVESVEYTS